MGRFLAVAVHPAVALFHAVGIERNQSHCVVVF